MERESFRSRLGFLLVSAGCAIGFGSGRSVTTDTQHPRQRPSGNSQARVKPGDAAGESTDYRPRSLNTAQCGGNSPRIR